MSDGDLQGICNARLHIPDEHGDNHAEMQCRMLAGHEGVHFESYMRGGNNYSYVSVSWTMDDAPPVERECTDCKKLVKDRRYMDECPENNCDGWMVKK